jgi:hypothetical protein
MSILTDSHPKNIRLRQQRAAELAIKLGLVSARDIQSRFQSIPLNLCQKRVAQERMIAHNYVRQFVRKLRDQEVFFVTVCRPEWTCGEGELSAALVREVRDWITRRARNLANHGQQRLLGYVDISWNDQARVGTESHWSVHAHFLVTIDTPPEYNSKRLIRATFKCAGDGEKVRRPLKVQRPLTAARVRGANDYASRALLLDIDRSRCSHTLADGTLQTTDYNLTARRELEYAKFLSDVGPRPFLILSGLRRQGSRIVRHDSTIETRVDKRYVRRRKGRSPTSRRR